VRAAARQLVLARDVELVLFEARALLADQVLAVAAQQLEPVEARLGKVVAVHAVNIADDPEPSLNEV
jgi:hypothetical protein